MEAKMAKTSEMEEGVSAPVEVDAGPTEQMKFSREALRKKIFSEENIKPKVIPLQFNGTDLEWRQPSIRDVQEAQTLQEGKNFMALMLIGYTYVPGTEEKVFADEDYEMILGMPLSPSWQGVVQKISDTLDLKVEEKVKN